MEGTDGPPYLPVKIAYAKHGRLAHQPLFFNTGKHHDRGDGQ